MKIEKITNSHIIQSINNSFPALFLALNLASICLLINNLSSSLLASKICLLIITLLPCFIAVVLSFYLTNRIEYCLFAFIILIITEQNNIISAYLIAIVLYYLNYIFEKYLLNYHFIKDLPKFVEDSVKKIILILSFIVITFIALQIKINLDWLSLFDLPITCILIIFLYCLLFYFGYHPALLLAFLGPIQLLFLSENIQAALLNLPLEHLFTHGTMSAFANMSGTGVTIGIVLLSKKLAPSSLKAAWFGVNENVIFGLPVTKNKKAFLPFVIGGTILGSFPFVLMALGYLNKPIFDAPYLGIFIEGFLVNFDYRSIIVNLIQIGGSLLFWKFLYREN